MTTEHEPIVIQKGLTPDEKTELLNTELEKRGWTRDDIHCIVGGASVTYVYTGGADVNKPENQHFLQPSGAGTPITVERETELEEPEEEPKEEIEQPESTWSRKQLNAWGDEYGVDPADYSNKPKMYKACKKRYRALKKGGA